MLHMLRCQMVLGVQHIARQQRRRRRASPLEEVAGLLQEAGEGQGLMEEEARSPEEQT